LFGECHPHTKLRRVEGKNRMNTQHTPLQAEEGKIEENKLANRRQNRRGSEERRKSKRFGMNGGGKRVQITSDK